MATGQDADWHYLRTPGEASLSQDFDGPRGFLTDAINWAGSSAAGAGDGNWGAVILNAHAGFQIFNTDLGLGVEHDDHIDDPSARNDDGRIPNEYVNYPINQGLPPDGLR